MKSKNEIYSALMAALWKLDNMRLSVKQRTYYLTKVEILSDILGDYVEEDFIDDIEDKLLGERHFFDEFIYPR